MDPEIKEFYKLVVDIMLGETSKLPALFNRTLKNSVKFREYETDRQAFIEKLTKLRTESEEMVELSTAQSSTSEFFQGSPITPVPLMKKLALLVNKYFPSTF